jgi:hypothetical protein
MTYEVFVRVFTPPRGWSSSGMIESVSRFRNPKTEVQLDDKRCVILM